MRHTSWPHRVGMFEWPHVRALAARPPLAPARAGVWCRPSNRTERAGAAGTLGMGASQSVREVGGQLLARPYLDVPGSLARVAPAELRLDVRLDQFRGQVPALDRRQVRPTGGLLPHQGALDGDVLVRGFRLLDGEGHRRRPYASQSSRRPGLIPSARTPGLGSRPLLTCGDATLNVCQADAATPPTGVDKLKSW